MPISYPGSLDTLSNPSAGDTQAAVSHSSQHANINDIAEQLETKVGTGASVPTTPGDVLTVTGAGATAWATPGGGSILDATVTLSSADILALHSTTITLVAAPGAGHYILPHRVVWYFAYGTSAYVNSASNITFGYGNAAQQVYSPNTIGSFGYTQDAIWSDTFLVDGYVADLADAAFTVWAGNGAITDGDGTLTVTVHYTIEDVPS